MYNRPGDLLYCTEPFINGIITVLSADSREINVQGLKWKDWIRTAAVAEFRFPLMTRHNKYWIHPDYRILRPYTRCGAADRGISRP